MGSSTTAARRNRDGSHGVGGSRDADDLRGTSPAGESAAQVAAQESAAQTMAASAAVAAFSDSSNGEDKRIMRSKCALRSALIELTEERGLDGFSASDLCAKAGLNRGTLYNNFGDKDGLLAALESDASGRACAMPCAPRSSKPFCTNATATTPRRSCSTTWRSTHRRIWGSSHTG